MSHGKTEYGISLRNFRSWLMRQFGGCCLLLSFMLLACTSVAAPPLNDNFANAQTLTGLYSFASASSAGATVEPGEPTVFGAATVSTIWYSWQAPTTTTVNIYTDGSFVYANSNFFALDTVLAVYSGATISQLVCVASNNDERFGLPASCVVFEAVEGTTYSIQVGGDVNGGDIRLSLIAAGALVPNDNFDQARLIVGSSGKETGTTVNSTLELGDPNDTNSFGGHSVWYRWIAPHNGSWAFSTDGSQFDTYLGVYTGETVSALATLAVNDDSADSTKRSMVWLNAVSNAEYFVSIDGYYRDAGDVVLNWGERQTNDNFDGSAILGQGMGSAYGRNVAASREAGEPASPGIRSLWYQWVAPATGLWTFNTQLSDFDTWLAFYSGPNISNLTLLASNDDVSGENHTSSIVVAVTNGIVYHVAVDGGSTSLPDGYLDYSVGSVRLNWFPFAPQILQASVYSNQFGLSFWTTFGMNHVTEQKAALSDPQWEPVTNCIGSGLVTQVVDRIDSRPQGFYRVRVE